MSPSSSPARNPLLAPLRHERAGRVQGHRPWPAPRGTWVMAQSWIDLLFAHWSVSPDALKHVVPAQLTLDTFDERAWIGVTPFEVRHLRPRPLPPLPLISRFAEINVRTYVVYDGKPGILFFSLDAASRLAVAAARLTYRLPYFHARMSVDRRGGRVHYETRRTDARAAAPAARFRAHYRPVGAPAPARAGTIDHWLTERYCLYTVDQHERVHRGEINHPPWPLAPAEATIDQISLTDHIGISLDGPPLLHYAARQDVVFWPLTPAR